MDADDHEYYLRGCGKSSSHNDEEDKCESYSRWGMELHECVCDENNCNGGLAFRASALTILFPAILRQMF